MYDYEANRDKLHSPNGNKLTTSLFEELVRDDVAAKPLFKLSDWRKTYVDLADPTGYEAAQVLIGSWDHWQALMKSPVFAAHVAEWNAEVDTKLKSEAIKQLRKQAKLPTGTAAAKVLAGIEGKPRSKKEAPADERTQREAKSKVADDAKRLGLSLVK